MIVRGQCEGVGGVVVVGVQLEQGVERLSFEIIYYVSSIFFGYQRGPYKTPAISAVAETTTGSLLNFT